MQRKTIGVLVNNLRSAFIRRILNGITGEARKENVSTIIFEGGLLGSDFDFKYHKSTVYRMVHSQEVDALLIFSYLIFRNKNPEEITRFCKMFRPVPILNIGINLPEVPSIYINNKQGMSELLTHLYSFHKYKRIAIVRGPANALDAEERLIEYITFFQSRNLEINTDLIVNGDFNYDSGVKAVKILLDERKIPFDAIIASNDNCALGIIAELKKRSIKVPEDIAVAGFDDTLQASIIQPGLTTVYQPIHEFGMKAFHTLYDSMKSSQPITLQTELPSSIVIRESCGCIHGEQIPYKADLTHGLNKITEDYLVKAAVPATEETTRQINQVIGLLLKQKSVDEQILKSEWQSFVYALYSAGCEGEYILKLISIIQEYLSLVQKPGHHKLITERIAQINALTIDLVESFRLDSDNKRNEDWMTLRDLHQMLEEKTDIDVMASIIEQYLLKLGFNHFFIALYDNLFSTEKLRLVLACTNAKKLEMKQPLYGSSKLLPVADLLSGIGRYNLVVKALYYGPYNIGIVILNKETWGYDYLEELRRILSDCLFYTLRIRDIESLITHKEELVHEKTENLMTRNKELKGIIKKLQDSISLTDKSLSLKPDFRIQKVLNYIENNYNSPITLADAAREAFMGRTYFSTYFKEATGFRFSDYLAEFRARKAVQLLRNPYLKIQEIAFMVGYTDANYFSKVFKKHSGMTPQKYRDIKL
ncbi:MAG: substrate-binding domain-containing protein [Spirochaetales bacterium]|nr:substrate-binding domain-containing protein [Spirochaetales bacterium]